MQQDLDLCIDLDNTLCELKDEEQSYADVLPKEGAVVALQELKTAGWKIIIHTARGMGSCKRNVGEMNVQVLPGIIAWLEKWEIPFDEIVLGKPNARYYIDDKALTFNNNWPEITKKLL